MFRTLILVVGLAMVESAGAQEFCIPRCGPCTQIEPGVWAHVCINRQCEEYRRPCSPPPPPPPPEVRIFGAEVNQGLPDYPRVAGKTTLARVYVGTSTEGSPVRVDRGVLTVVARTSGATFTIDATIPNPLFDNTTQRYSENDNVNFYIPGTLVPEDGYYFTARLYNGTDLLGTVIFPSNPYYFTATNDLRLLVVTPHFFEYERPFADLAQLSDYLDDLARVLPVRDGWGSLGDAKGVQVDLRLFDPVCDGRFPSPYPDCGPSLLEMLTDPWAAFKWTLVQPRGSGQRRTITSGEPCQVSYVDDGQGSFATELVEDAFLYFPGWIPNTADQVYDLNYDGQINPTELAPYVSEYFNRRTGRWSSDLSQLLPGDIVRNFVDLNRNCRYDLGEPRAPSTDGKLVRWMIQHARSLADAADLRYAAYVIWAGMDRSGTGGGTQYGNTVWAVLKPWPAFHQELGHAFGLVPSGSPNADPADPRHSRNYVFNDPRAFDISRRRAIPNPVISVMAGQLSSPYQNSLLEVYEYTWLWDRFRRAMAY